MQGVECQENCDSMMCTVECTGGQTVGGVTRVGCTVYRGLDRRGDRRTGVQSLQSGCTVYQPDPAGLVKAVKRLKPHIEMSLLNDSQTKY